MNKQIIHFGRDPYKPEFYNLIIRAFGIGSSDLSEEIRDVLLQKGFMLFHSDENIIEACFRNRYPEVLDKFHELEITGWKTKEESIMICSQKTINAMDRWLSPDTWYKLDKADDDRYFRFVRLLWEDIKNLPNDLLDDDIIKLLTEQIEKHHPGFTHVTGNEEYIRRYQNRTRDILDFLNSTFI